MPCNGHPCQKQPSTKTAILAVTNTTSGRPGSEFAILIRYRRLAAQSARRNRSSISVPVCRTRLMRALRCSGVRMSTMKRPIQTYSSRDSLPASEQLLVRPMLSLRGRTTRSDAWHPVRIGHPTRIFEARQRRGRLSSGDGFGSNRSGRSFGPPKPHSYRGLLCETLQASAAVTLIS